MDLNFFLLLITILIDLSLAAYVYFKNRQSRVNVSFSLLLLSVAFWAFTNIVCLKVRTVWGGIIWSEVSYISATLIASTFLYFSYIFPPSLSSLKKFLFKPRHKLYIVISIPLVSVIVFIPNFTVKTVVLEPWKIITGTGLYIFAFHFLFTMAWMFYNLFRKYLISRGIERTQLKYLFLGSGLSTILGSFCNLILPLQRNYKFVWLGPVFSLIMMVSIAYAILRYRFMDIRVVMGKGAIYLLAFLIISALSFLIIFVSKSLAVPLSFPTLAPIVILLTIIFFKILKVFEGIGAKYFYPGFSQRKMILSSLEEELAYLLELGTFSHLVADSLKEAFLLDKIAILTKAPTKRVFNLQVSQNFNKKEIIELSEDANLTSIFLKIKTPFSSQELPSFLEKEREAEKVQNIKTLKEKLEKLGIEISIPLLFEKEVIGIIFLGKKMSKDPFSKEDFDILATLTFQTSIALKNTLLYSEIKKRKEELETFYRLTVGRELKMQELKRKVTELEQENQELKEKLEKTPQKT